MILFTRRSNRWLATLALVTVAFQFWIIYHVTPNQPSSIIVPPPSSPKRMETTTITTTTTMTTTNDSIANTTTTTTTTRPPRILIGILVNAHSLGSEQYIQRHLQLFALWNDTRLCPISQVQAPCQVIYAFIYGSTNITLPPYQNDVTYTLHGSHSIHLHIRETMNKGKTPAFFQWAINQSPSQSLDIDYIFKCDSDSFLRWNALLRYIYTELPYPPVSTLVGMLRHKAAWTNITDEQLWQQEWYAGMHLYLAGQLYGMSVDVAKLMIQEANPGMPFSYFAGHEDHDATSMIQVASIAYQQHLRWVSVGKHNTFWEHPVKGDYRWERILSRERRQYQERLEGTRPLPPVWIQQATWVKTKPSIVLIVLESSQTQLGYLKEWKLRNPLWERVCGISQWGISDSACDLYYVFVRGVDPSGPTELLSDALHMTIEEDTWNFSIRHMFHDGLMTTVLYWMHQQDRVNSFDYVLVLNASFLIRLKDWYTLAHNQPSRHHATLLGEVRDKYQSPREFVSKGQEVYWWKEYDEIHLYLGSECFGIGSQLVEGIVEQAMSNSKMRQKYWEHNVGHDLTALAYMVPKKALQWIPVTKSMRFWEPL